jgi:molecular chaperone GrpE
VANSGNSRSAHRSNARTRLAKRRQRLALNAALSAPAVSAAVGKAPAQPPAGMVDEGTMVAAAQAAADLAASAEAAMFAAQAAQSAAEMATAAQAEAEALRQQLRAAENTIEALTRQLEAARSEAHEIALKARTELETQRRRLQREREEFKRTANAELLESLLPPLDNFDLALLSLETATDTATIAQGVRLIHEGLVATLHRSGLERIKALGETFDPNLHEAAGTVVDADEPPNKVLVVLRAGYTYGGRVLRPAMVKVNVLPTPQHPSPSSALRHALGPQAPAHGAAPRTPAPMPQQIPPSSPATEEP